MFGVKQQPRGMFALVRPLSLRFNAGRGLTWWVHKKTTGTAFFLGATQSVWKGQVRLLYAGLVPTRPSVEKMGENTDYSKEPNTGSRRTGRTDRQT